MKLAAALCVIGCAFACGRQDEPTPTEAPSGSYSAAAATRALDALDACTSPHDCAAFDTLATFGGAAEPQLIAYISDLGKPEAKRGLVAILIGKARLPDAGPKLVEIGLSSTDAAVTHAFLEAAGACGGDATFAALAAQYARENHGDMHEHLVELAAGLEVFPAKAKPWAMGALPEAKDQVKYADVIVALARPADRDALIALAAAAKEQMAKQRLAAKAIALGATDPALWDVLTAGLSSRGAFERDDAGDMLEDIAEKIPADRRPRIAELIKQALAVEHDPRLQGGLATTLKKLGG